jgi:predicted DNA-binding protein with PD1-like motif
VVTSNVHTLVKVVACAAAFSFYLDLLYNLGMKIYAVRLLPGQDLKTELIKFTKENNIQAGFIITCVGSVSRARLRMADDTVIKDFEKPYEIVSMVGTLCPDDVHIHLSLSDESGSVIGGHLKEGCPVLVTAEIVIGESEDHLFSREMDPNTGFPEIKIQKRS